MKRYHSNLLVLFVLAIIIGSTFIGCGRRTKEQIANRKIELNPTNSKQIKLSQIFSKADVINLNLTDIVYAKPKKIVVKDNHFFMLSRSAIIVCNTNGELILHIFRRGRGPGEYLDIIDFHIRKNEFLFF